MLPKKSEYLKKIDASNATVQQNLTSGRRSKRALNTTAKKWQNIGPYKTAKNDQYTGFVTSYDSHANVFRIDVFKKDPNILYCGAETGVVFKTTDKGLNWQACDPTFNFGKEIKAIHIDPSDSNTIWVGSDVGLFVTRNGGTSFTRIDGITSTVNSIRVSPSDKNEVTVAAADGFYRSTDGKSFQKILNGKFYDHELKPKTPKTVYLLGEKKTSDRGELYISYDGGATFNKTVDVQGSGVKTGRLAVTHAPGGENYLYALVSINDFSYRPHGQPRILKSTDAGLTWTDKTVKKGTLEDWSNTFCPSIDGRSGGQGYYDTMTGVSDTNPEHIIFGLCSAYRSLKGGEGGYKETAIGGYCSGNLKIHPDMQDIAVAGDEVWIANDGGIKYSPSFFDKQGEDRVNGIYAADFWGFGQGWNEDVMAGGRWHNGDAVMINNNSYGKTSVYVGGVEQATGYVMLSNPKKVYFSDGAALFTMPDKLDGQILADYQKFYTRPYEVLKNHGFMATDPRYAMRILIHPSQNFWSASGRIEETKNEGGINSFTTLFDTQGEPISNIEFARSNPNTIYACGIYYVYKSIDNGKTWSQLPQIPKEVGFTYYSYNPTSYLTVNPKDENKLWIVQSQTPGAVASSEDGGKTWKNMLSNTKLKDQKIRWVILTGDEYNGVYLGADDEGKIYYKDDTLTDWIDYSEGFPIAARLTRLLPFYKEGKLRAGTSQGIWEIPLYHQNFKPVAQPLALNLAQAELPNADEMVFFDLYSIVNQSNIKWEWSFSPEPYYVDNHNIRNPKVIFKYNGNYDVTLKVTTPEGSHSRTIPNMVIVKNGTNLATGEASVQQNQVEVYPSLLNVGEDLKIKLNNFSAKKDKQFMVYDARGVLVKHLRLDQDNTLNQLSTKGLPKGVYIYLFVASDYKKYGKFIVK